MYRRVHGRTQPLKVTDRSRSYTSALRPARHRAMVCACACGSTHCRWAYLLTTETRTRCLDKHRNQQGNNARKVISEVYAFFVLQFTVFGRKSEQKTDVTAWHGIHFYKNNQWNILDIENFYVNFQNYQN